MRYLTALMLSVAVAAFAAAAPAKKGTPEIKSITAMAFNSDGVLFVGDSTSAKVFAIETGDAKSSGKGDLKVEKINDQIAIFNARGHREPRGVQLPHDPRPATLQAIFVPAPATRRTPQLDGHRDRHHAARLGLVLAHHERDDTGLLAPRRAARDQ